MAANGITVNMPPSKFNTWLWAEKSQALYVSGF